MIDIELQRRFAGLLLPRERILWAGRPKQGFMFQSADWFLLPFTLFWAGGSVGLPLIRGAINWSLHSLFFLPFALISFYMLIGRYIYDAWLRRRTSYAVTDQRILVLREGLGGGLKTIVRAGLQEIEIKEHGALGSIYFGSGGANHLFQLGTRSVSDSRTHFRSIPDARAVFALLQRFPPQPTIRQSSMDEYAEP